MAFALFLRGVLLGCSDFQDPSAERAPKCADWATEASVALTHSSAL